MNLRLQSERYRYPSVDFCAECDERGLLMPVRICPGSFVVVVVGLCVSCRVNWRDCGRTLVCLATTIEHSPTRLRAHPRHSPFEAIPEFA